MFSVYYWLYVQVLYYTNIYCIGSIALPLNPVLRTLYPLLISWSMFRTLSASYDHHGQVSSSRGLIFKTGPERNIFKELSISVIRIR